MAKITGTGADKIYDLTNEQREVLEWKAKKRLELRNQYLKEVWNPNQRFEGHIFDEGLQRWYTMRFSAEKLFKPNFANFFCWTALTFGVYGLMLWHVKSDRDAKELAYRTGQVSYRDRQWKFC